MIEHSQGRKDKMLFQVVVPYTMIYVIIVSNAIISVLLLFLFFHSSSRIQCKRPDHSENIRLEEYIIR